MNTSNSLPSSVQLYRSQLLPVWIKFFCKLFLYVVPFLIVFTLFIPLLPEKLFSKYNIIIIDFSFSLNNILILLMLILKIITALALTREKNYAVTLAKTDAVLSLISCVSNMFYNYYNNHSIFIRLDLLIVIPYLLLMFKISEAWRNAKVSPLQAKQ